MRRLALIVSLVFGMTVWAQAQRNVPLMDDSITALAAQSYAYLNKGGGNGFDFSDGFPNFDEDNLYHMSFLVENQRYEYIERLLYSGLPSTQMLSAVTVLYLKRKRKIGLDSLDAKRIQEIRESEKTFWIRNGCLVSESKPLKKMLFLGGRGSLFGRFLLWHIKRAAK